MENAPTVSAAALPPPQQQAHAWETVKENFKPLKKGRSPEELAPEVAPLGLACAAPPGAEEERRCVPSGVVVLKHLCTRASEQAQRSLSLETRAEGGEREGERGREKRGRALRQGNCKRQERKKKLSNSRIRSSFFPLQKNKKQALRGQARKLRRGRSA